MTSRELGQYRLLRLGGDSADVKQLIELKTQFDNVKEQQQVLSLQSVTLRKEIQEILLKHFISLKTFAEQHNISSKQALNNIARTPLHNAVIFDGRWYVTKEREVNES